MHVYIIYCTNASLHNSHRHVYIQLQILKKCPCTMWCFLIMLGYLSIIYAVFISDIVLKSTNHSLQK